MSGWVKWIAIRWSAFRDRLLVRRTAGGRFFGPLLIDRGRGLLYDVERDLTWLQDTNYAKTSGHSPDGQITWDNAKRWVARLNYRGITGWRLPTALNPDGSGPAPAIIAAKASWAIWSSPRSRGLRLVRT
jgi:hypothetical protein